MTNDELLPNAGSDIKPEINQVREAKKENTYRGSLSLHPNHKMFKYIDGVVTELSDSDYHEPEIKIVEPFKVYLKKPGTQIGNYRKRQIKKVRPTQTKSVRKIIVEPNAYYHGALNIANAVKFYKKLGLPIRLIERASN